MSEYFDKLKRIGAQKIHENTHISRLHVESILEEDFTKMTKIQLLGFISILEREYGLDLEALKNSAIKYFQDIQEEEGEKDIKIFLVPKRRRNLTPIYLVVVFMIFISIVFVSIRVSSSNEKVSPIDNRVIQSAKSNIEPIIEPKVDENITVPEVIQEPEPEPIANIDANKEITSFKILPKVKVWLGYVDLGTHKKYQKTFKDEFDLDPSKDWLLAFGHGRLQIEINGVVKKYKNKKNVRFSYIDGKLEEISLEEFKRLNKGSRW